MADWLEEFHENVHPIGDPSGLWSGCISKCDLDPDTMDLELYLRMPLQQITVTLVPPEESGDGENLQQSRGVHSDEGERSQRTGRTCDLVPTEH